MTRDDTGGLVAEALRDARRLVAACGRGADGQPYRVLGAINDAVDRLDASFTRRQLAAAGARESMRAACGTASLDDWNNEPGRTEAEVIAAFDTALAAWGVSGDADADADGPRSTLPLWWLQHCQGPPGGAGCEFARNSNPARHKAHIGRCAACGTDFEDPLA